LDDSNPWEIGNIYIAVGPGKEVNTKIIFASEPDDPFVPPPTIRDVVVQKLLNPSIKNQKQLIYKEESFMDVSGLPSGYYGIQVHLSNGDTYSESHYIH